MIDRRFGRIRVHQVKRRTRDFALNAEGSRHALNEKSFARAQAAFQADNRSLAHALRNLRRQFYRPVWGLRYVSKQKDFISYKFHDFCRVL